MVVKGNANRAQGGGGGHGGHGTQEGKIAPEGGWGYFVCVGSVLVFVCCFSHMHSMGIMYKDFLDSVGAGASGLTFVSGISSVSLSTAGVFANIAMKRFSLRQVGWVGATSVSLGWLLNTQVTSVLQLALTVGVIQGFGSGMLISVALTSFNQYFVKRRMAFMSLNKVLTGVGNIAAPLLLESSLKTYGFRGTMLLAAAVSTHGILGVTSMHPVEWHQKKKDTKPKSIGAVEDQEEKTLLKSNEKSNQMKNVQEETKKIPNNSLENDPHLMSQLSYEETDDKFVEISEKEIDSHLVLANQRTARSLSIISTGQGVITLDMLQQKKSKWATVMEFFDFDLFKDPKFCNICFGLSFALITDAVFFMLLPLSLLDSNFTSVAWCVSLVSTTDLVSRGVIGVLGHFFNITSRNLFFFGTCGAFVLRFAYCQVQGFLPICLVVGALGFIRGFIVVPMMLLYADYIPEKFTAAFGLSTLITGIFMTVLLPLFGFLKDITGSFIITFHAVNVLALFCIIPWIIEFILDHKRKKPTI